jgi:hypothetical protein
MALTSKAQTRRWCSERVGVTGVKRFPEQPAQPERLCWGCDRYCASTDMLCGNGSVRTPHPMELFGPDWNMPLTPPRPVAGSASPAGDAAMTANGVCDG